MKRVLFVVLEMFLLSVSVAAAQTSVPLTRGASRNNPSAYGQEAGLSVGILGVAHSQIGADVLLGADYAHYYWNGLGWRAGLQYSSEYSDIDDFVGMPVALAWRSGLRTPGKSFYSASESLGYYLYSEPAGFSDLLVTFLLNLFSRFEVFGGVTPGYLFGGSDISRSDYRNSEGAAFEEDGIRVASPFYLSADLGFALSYRIGRFNLRLSPVVHYIVTDSFRRWHRFESDSMPPSSLTDKPLSWAVSAQAGLYYMF